MSSNTEKRNSELTDFLSSEQGYGLPTSYALSQVLDEEPVDISELSISQLEQVRDRAVSIACSLLETAENINIILIER